MDHLHVNEASRLSLLLVIILLQFFKAGVRIKIENRLDNIVEFCELDKEHGIWLDRELEKSV